MVTWRVVFTRQALKDAKKISKFGLKPQAERLIELLKKTLLKPHLRTRNLLVIAGSYYRRINIQHRLVYQILEEITTVKCGHSTNNAGLLILCREVIPLAAFSPV